MSLLNAVRHVLASIDGDEITLGLPVDGFRSMADAGAVDGQPYSWAIEANFVNGVAQDREGGKGVWNETDGTLARDTEWSTEAANAQITVTGDAHVIITPLAADILQAATETIPGRTRYSTIAEAKARAHSTSALTPAGLDAALEAAPDIRRNRIVNGAMQISQENGTTGGTSDRYYAADQWYMHRSHGGTSTFARVASVSPAGSPNRLRVTVTAQDTSVAAGDFLAICQDLEGLNVADFMWGTASAKPAVVRIGMKGPAGTYCVSINNPAFDRSFIAEVVISGGEADTDVVKEVAIPAQTGGTWVTSNAIAWTLAICLMAGSDRQNTAGWQTNSTRYKYATSNQTNWMGNSNSTTFEIFDVGLKMDAEAIGQYGAYEVPDSADELRRCQRYYRRINALHVFTLFAVGLQFSSAGAVYPIFFQDNPMRTAPTFSSSAATTFFGTAITADILTVEVARINMTVSGTTGDCVILQANNTTSAYLAFNARMS